MRFFCHPSHTNQHIISDSLNNGSRVPFTLSCNDDGIITQGSLRQSIDPVGAIKLTLCP